MTIRIFGDWREESVMPPAPDSQRSRVLLFDGNDSSVATAAPALDGLGIEVVLASLKSPQFEPCDRDVLAVVVCPPRSNNSATTDLVMHLRTVCTLPVLLLAPRTEDDVLLQEIHHPSKGPPGVLVPLEFAQQIRAILRREPSRVLRFGRLEIDMGAREVRVDQRAVELSRREFDLISFLASSPGRAYTRLELLQAVWHSSGEWQTLSTVTEHVRRIRTKLQTRPDLPHWLVTVRGTGYRFQP